MSTWQVQLLIGGHLTMVKRSPRFSRSLAVAFVALFASLSLLVGCGSGGSVSSGGAQPQGVQASASSGDVTGGFSQIADTGSMGDFVPVATLSDVAPRNEAGKLKVLISYRDQASKTDEDLVLSKGGEVSHRYSFVNVVAASVPDSAVNELAADPRVEKIEPDLGVQILGTELQDAWGVSHIGAGLVHAGGNTGSGIKVAILDTGIDYTHPDLADSYAGGYDFINNDNDPTDDHGHGTHVAGTVAACSNGTGVIGVAPGARLYALKVLGANGSGSFSAVIAALQWCVANNIQVTNCSLGSAGNPGTAVENAFIAAQNSGIVNVAAAGNSGNANGTGDCVNYPARYNSVIAVGATDVNDARASFSSTGPKVEIAAPGLGIVSCLMGGGYASKSGTSMASPHVAGAVALALKAGVAPSAVRTRLQQTVLDLGAKGRDPLFGYGLVNAPKLSGVTNTASSLTIQTPVANRQYPSGIAVSFSASAVDIQDGDISSSVVWTINNTTATGATVSQVLPDGAYTARATVTDAGGLKTTATVKFSVLNQAPVTTITSPANLSAYDYGASITFSGTAVDPEDGDVSSSIVWKRAGTTIGTGATLTTTLPGGTSTITAQVTDSKARVSKVASVKVVVGYPTPSMTTGSDKNEYVNKETVSISSNLSFEGAPIQGATLKAVITTPTGRTYTASGSSASNGTAIGRFVLNTATHGTGTFGVTVTSTKTGYKSTTATTSFKVK